MYHKFLFLTAKVFHLKCFSVYGIYEAGDLFPCGVLIDSYGFWYRMP